MLVCAHLIDQMDCTLNHCRNLQVYTCWFSKLPLGHNKLEGTVARLCKSARRIRTNRSLWATAATRLYNAAIEEQQVLEITGHRSTEGVRSYKRTSTTQKQLLSDVLNCQETVSVNHSDTEHTTTYAAPQPSTYNFQGCTVNIYNSHT